MKSYSIVMLSLTMSLMSMDTEEDSSSVSEKKKHEVHINIPTTSSDTTLSPLRRIGTMEQLRQVRASNSEKRHGMQGQEQPTVSPEVAATVAHTVVFKTDPDIKTSTKKVLKKKFRDMEQTDPENYQKVNQHILTLNQKYEGNISPEGMREYRERKHSNADGSSKGPETPSSSSESPKRKAVNILLKQQSTLRKEVEQQEQSLEDMKKESREMKELIGKLTLQAAEDAASEANKLAKISIAVGALTTMLAAAIGAGATYYSSNSSSGSQSCAPCNCTNITMLNGTGL